MELDPCILTKFLSITKGYTFKGIFPTDQPIEHVCVVISKSVTKGENLYYVYLTSEESAVRVSRDDPDSLVDLDYSEYSHYYRRPREKTYIQCNKRHLKSSTYDEVIQKSIIVDRVATSVVEKIENAIKSSISYTDHDRKEILN